MELVIATRLTVGNPASSGGRGVVARADPPHDDEDSVADAGNCEVGVVAVESLGVSGADLVARSAVAMSADAASDVASDRVHPWCHPLVRGSARVDLRGATLKVDLACTKRRYLPCCGCRHVPVSRVLLRAAVRAMGRLDPVDECAWPVARAWYHHLGPAVSSLAVAGLSWAHGHHRRHLLL